MSTVLRFLTAALIALVVGCAAPAPRQQPAPIETGRSEQTAPAPEPADRLPPSGAFDSLLDRAKDARRRGDNAAALALLERAQRIDATRSSLYLELARTHSAAGDSEQARAVAERGLLYCTGRECKPLRDILGS